MRFNILVREIMVKDVKTASLDDTVKKAAEIMKNNRIGSVVVMGEKNIKGILTTRDIVYKYVAENSGGLVKDIKTMVLPILGLISLLANLKR